jgi:hypothetical protein
MVSGAGSPTGLTGTTLVASVQPPATNLSCGVVPSLSATACNRFITRVRAGESSRTKSQQSVFATCIVRHCQLVMENPRTRARDSPCIYHRPSLSPAKPRHGTPISERGCTLPISHPFFWYLTPGSHPTSVEPLRRRHPCVLAALQPSAKQEGQCLITVSNLQLRAITPRLL